MALLNLFFNLEDSCLVWEKHTDDFLKDGIRSHLINKSLKLILFFKRDRWDETFTFRRILDQPVSLLDNEAALASRLSELTSQSLEYILLNSLNIQQHCCCCCSSETIDHGTIGSRDLGWSFTGSWAFFLLRVSSFLNKTFKKDNARNQMRNVRVFSSCQCHQVFPLQKISSPFQPSSKVRMIRWQKNNAPFTTPALMNKISPLRPACHWLFFKALSKMATLMGLDSTL